MINTSAKYSSIVLIATCLATIKCNCQQTTIQDYLLFAYETTEREYEFEWVKEQVEARGGESIIETANYLRKATKIAHRIAFDNEIVPQAEDDTGVTLYDGFKLHNLWIVLRFLEKLSRPETYPDCTPLAAQRFLHMIRAIFAGSLEAFLSGAKPTHHLKLFNYMTHYGSSAYKHCMAWISGKFTELLEGIDKEAETMFDEMFAAGKPSIMNDDQRLYELAHSTNFHQGRFNARGMLRAIQYHQIESKEYPGSANALIRFLYHICGRIRRPLVRAFDPYNLGLALNRFDASDPALKSRERKLNEYLRLCRQLEITHLQSKTVENIRRNMDNIWYRKMVRKLCSSISCLGRPKV